MLRRSFLGGAAAVSLPTVAAARTVDQFINSATPAELVRYHSNALLEALAAKYPGELGWRVHTDTEHKFVLIVPGRKPGIVWQNTGVEV